MLILSFFIIHTLVIFLLAKFFQAREEVIKYTIKVNLKENEEELNFTPEFEEEKLKNGFDKILLLPNDFYISNAWRKRFIQISTSTKHKNKDMIGDLGPCAMHTMQIVAELLQNPLRARKKGGIFFNTKKDASYLANFCNRNKRLCDKLLDSFLNRFKIQNEDGISNFHEQINIFMPNIDWIYLGKANINECENLLVKLTNAYGVRVYIAQIFYLNIENEPSNISHVMPLIRTLDGIYAIPTNYIYPNENFDFLLTHFATNISSLRDLIYFAAKVDEDEVFEIELFEARAFL